MMSIHPTASIKINEIAEISQLYQIYTRVAEYTNQTMIHGDLLS